MFVSRLRLLFPALAGAALAVSFLGASVAAEGGTVEEGTVEGGTVESGTVESGTVEGTVTVYTSVTQDTVDAVLAALAEVHPGLEVEVFRAPTGELDARIASERRIGGLGADLLWLTDPLSVQRYEADGLLARLEGEAFAVVPDEYKGDTFVGTRLLNLVLVSGADVEDPPASWAELASAEGVVMPDPGFAGSAFAALGYLGTNAEYGLAFYQALKDNGARVVQSPVDVVTGVAEGIYRSGITLDKIARASVAAGAPIVMTWPEAGAIALFSPAAVVAESDDLAAAQAFQAFLVSPEAQAAIASTGWQPVRDDVAWPYEDTVVTADWDELYGRQAELLDGFRAIFGD
ncbi:MAG: extracellular solute-binding protein [Chloroflexota bacterium]|jgi:iron(III) transport system substrate-binding protein